MYAISVDDRLTARENLRFHAMLYDVPSKTMGGRIQEVLQLVGLTDRADSLVRTFSGGMVRRLEMARGLLHNPEILFLDEPKRTAWNLFNMASGDHQILQGEDTFRKRYDNSIPVAYHIWRRHGDQPPDRRDNIRIHEVVIECSIMALDGGAIPLDKTIAVGGTESI